METGVITKWIKKEGELISAGDIICEVETDKAVVEFEAQDDYYLAKILKSEGSGDIHVGDPIFVSTPEQENVSAFQSFQIEDSSTHTENAPPQSNTNSPQNEPNPTQVEKKQGQPQNPVRFQANEAETSRIFATPFAKKLARENNISLDSISGSGPHNRILHADIQEHLSAPHTQNEKDHSSFSSPHTPLPPSSDFAISQLSKDFANSLTHQKTQVPHYHLSITLTLDKLLQARQQLNSYRKDNSPLSVYAFLLRAASLSMQSVPQVNSTWKTDFIRQFHNVDINVIVTSKGQTLAPMISNVHSKGLSLIEQDLERIMQSAESFNFNSKELGKGTFTMSNLGMFGVKDMSGIICPDQACLLSLGAIEKVIVPNNDLDAKVIYKEAIQMKATLACDHRIVDGAVGAKWLSVFKELVEDPLKMIL